MSAPDETPDYYKILGVDRSATQRAIKKAFRGLVSKYHPDRHQGNDLQDLAQQRLAEVNEAYGVLGDAGKRRQYDAGQLGQGPFRGNPFAGGAGGRPSPNAPPSYLRPIILILGIAGFGILLKFLRNPKAWFVVAGIVAVVWGITVYRRRKGR